MMGNQRHATLRTTILAARGPIAVMAALIVATAVAQGPSQGGNVTVRRLLHADAEPGEWMSGGRDYKQSYYSPLAQIITANIAKLGFAWAQNIGPAAAPHGTPIVVDGVMYASGGTNVYALDARDGK